MWSNCINAHDTDTPTDHQIQSLMKAKIEVKFLLIL